jgi:hypothetical protein
VIFVCVCTFSLSPVSAIELRGPENDIVAPGSNVWLQLRVSNAKSVIWSFTPTSPDSEQFVYSSLTNKTIEGYYVERSVPSHYDLIINETHLEHAGKYKAAVVLDQEVEGREYSAMVSVVENPVCQSSDIRLTNCRVNHAGQVKVSFLITRPDALDTKCDFIKTSSSSSSGISRTECRLPIPCDECSCSVQVVGTTYVGSSSVLERVATNVPNHITKSCVVDTSIGRTPPITRITDRYNLNSSKALDEISRKLDYVIISLSVIAVCGFILVLRPFLSRVKMPIWSCRQKHPINNSSGNEDIRTNSTNSINSAENTVS